MTYPITPPTELVQQWLKGCPGKTALSVAAQAAQWGADQELKACVEWAQGYAECGDSLRAARRPKPPSLKEVALEDLRSIELLQKEHKMVACTFNIRRALERLKELEGPND